MVVVVSALLGAVVAVGTTVAIERLGGRLGGVVGTMPTTIVVACWGLWAASPGEAFSRAMGAVCVGLVADALFLTTWRALPRRLSPGWHPNRRLVTLVGASLGVWAVGASLGLALSDTQALRGHPLMVGAAALVVLAALGTWLVWTGPVRRGGGRRVGYQTLALRGVLAAVAVGGAVALGALGVPALAGLAAVFPAVFLTTMVSLWVSQGEDVPMGAVGSIALGSTSVGVFALVAAWSFPTLGPVPGTLCAWAVAVSTVSLPVALRLRR